MQRPPRSASSAGILLIFAATAVRGDAAQDAYRAMSIKPADILNGTVLTARVKPGDAKQIVALVTYFTGTKDEAHGVNVRLEIFAGEGEKPSSLYARDYGKENGGHVGRGELELLDLDGDGVNEVVVTYEDARAPLVQQRRAEVLIWEGSGLRVAWTDVLEYDATRAVRGVPPERRDRFTREIDVVATRRTKGASLVVKKKMLAVAGEKLDEPRVLQEAFPLRPASANP